MWIAQANWCFEIVAQHFTRPTTSKLYSGQKGGAYEKRFYQPGFNVNWTAE